jgi:hypothetical protein
VALNRNTMFNKNSSASEIEQSMERSIVSAAIEKQTEGLNKVASAIEHLNAAAELFDDAGMYKVAEYTTALLEVLAKKKKPKAKKKSDKPSKDKKSSKKSKADPATEGLTSEKMVENLAHKGWVFNADDNASDDNFAHDHDCMCSMCMDVNDAKEKRNHGHDCCCPHCLGVKHSHDDDCMCSMCMDANDAVDTNFHFDTTDDAGWHMDRHSVDDSFTKDTKSSRMDKELENTLERHRPGHEKEVHEFSDLHDFEDEDALEGLPTADKAKQEDFWNVDLFGKPTEQTWEPAMKPRRRF